LNKNLGEKSNFLRKKIVIFEEHFFGKKNLNQYFWNKIKMMEKIKNCSGKIFFGN